MAKINLKNLDSLRKIGDQMNDLWVAPSEYAQSEDNVQQLVEAITNKIQVAIQNKDYGQQIGYFRNIGLPIDLAGALEMYPNAEQVIQDAVKLYLIEKKAIQEVPKQEVGQLQESVLSKYKDGKLIDTLHNIERDQAVNPENMEQFVQNVVGVFTSQEEKAQRINKLPLQKAMEANRDLKEAMIGAMLNSYMQLEQQGGIVKQNQLATVYKSLFQKGDQQLLGPDSAIGTFLHNPQKRKVLKQAMKSVGEVETSQDAIKDMDYSHFDLHLLGKMARLSEEVDADLDKGEGVGSKIQSTLYEVAKVCLALIGIVMGAMQFAKNIRGGMALFSGDLMGASMHFMGATGYSFANNIAGWTKEYLEKLEKKPQEEFMQATVEVEKELKALLPSKQQEVQKQQKAQPQEKLSQKKPQPAYMKHLKKVEKHTARIKTGREVAKNLPERH